MFETCEVFLSTTKTQASPESKEEKMSSVSSVQLSVESLLTYAKICFNCFIFWAKNIG